jgi:hypothetical protein
VPSTASRVLAALRDRAAPPDACRARLPRSSRRWRSRAPRRGRPTERRDARGWSKTRVFPVTRIWAGTSSPSHQGNLMATSPWWLFLRMMFLRWVLPRSRTEGVPGRNRGALGGGGGGRPMRRGIIRVAVFAAVVAVLVLSVPLACVMNRLLLGDAQAPWSPRLARPTRRRPSKFRTTAAQRAWVSCPMVFPHSCGPPVSGWVARQAAGRGGRAGGCSTLVPNSGHDWTLLLPAVGLPSNE